MLGLELNLGLVGYYKYAGFFLQNVGIHDVATTLIIPRAISFFTFRQIACLVETWRGQKPADNALASLLFVLFFPHLIAGPITHHTEMLPQVARAGRGRLPPSFIGMGATILVPGMAKKVLLADTIAQYADPVFAAAAHGAVLSLANAWMSAVVYTLRLYFDFSGYSGMAIGVGLLFGIRFPLNFNSPCKSTNIVDFWRPWHMSLSAVLRTCLSIPLGGNRAGRTRRYVNLMVAMTLGGDQDRKNSRLKKTKEDYDLAVEKPKVDRYHFAIKKLESMMFPAVASDSTAILPAAEQGRHPLVVDLDDSLVRSDTLFEAAFAAVSQNPFNLFHLLLALRHGKAALKRTAAQRGRFDPALLPYDKQVLALIHEAHAEGRKVFLATAADAAIAHAIADHLQLFDGVFCSDGSRNLAGPNKAHALVAAFGQGGFDYLGNDVVDLAIWREAHGRIAARAAPAVMRALQEIDPQAVLLPRESASLRVWLKLLRVHQYAKNALILAPLFTAHAFGAGSLGLAALAIIAFSMAASGVYVLNDLMDLQADRAHRTKRLRPLASGRVPLKHGIAAVPILLLSGLGLAAAVSPRFLGVLASYLVVTTLYTFWLKRKLLVDVVTLALLYVVRVIAGAAAIDVPMSHWFLGFALFVFTCLALVKRYVECAAHGGRGAAVVRNRAYTAQDAEALLLLAAAAGFNAVTVLALYISSDAVRLAYGMPELLWLLCPIMIYWIARVVLLARRGQVHDDPIIFAMKDRGSVLTLALIAVTVLLAI